MEAEQAISLGNVGKLKPEKKSKVAFLLKILFLLVIVIGIVTSITIAVLRNDRFQFKDVQVYGTTTFSSDELIAFTHEYWSGHYFKAIPKTSTIFFSKDNFEKALRKQFPIISVAYITLPEPDHLEIHIEERTPVMTWCFADESCGFVDSNGVLYARAPQFSDGVYPIFQSELNDPTYRKMGSKIIDPVVMNRFIALFKKLQSDDITLSRTYLYQNGDIAFSIAKLFGNYPKNDAKLLGTMAQDDTIFTRDMLTGLGNDAFKRQFLSNPKDLEYIDMRFPGKIFYKFGSNQQPLEKTMTQNN